MVLSRTIYRVVAVCFIAPLLLVSACGGGGSGGVPVEISSEGTTTDGITTDDGTTTDGLMVDPQLQRELTWLYDKLKTEYLWYQDTPDLDYLDFDSAEDLLEAMVDRNQDRFSYITSAERNTQSQTATNVTYGFRARTSVQPFEIVRVYNGSSAAEADMQRGDKITRIGSIDILDAESAVEAWALVSARTEGSELDFEFEREGQTQPMSARLAATEVSRQTVDSVLANDLGLGYLNIFEFRSKTDNELRNAFAFFGAKSVDRLIIDLRDNGGGSIRSIAVLGSLILGQARAGETFIDFRFSDLGEAIFQSPDYTTGYNLGIEDNAVPMQAVHIIASGATCSASEILINSLRPYIDVSVSGTTTCGKPFGFYGRRFEDKSVLWAINFQSDNALGQGGWVEGLAPTCEVRDFQIFPYGDTRDRHFLSAVNFLSSGDCTVPVELSVNSRRRANLTGSGHSVYEPVWRINDQPDRQW